MKKIGWIGCGNMGEAMLAGALKNKWATAEDVLVYDKFREKNEAVRTRYGVETVESCQALAEKAKILVLAVKPIHYEEVLRDIAPVLGESHVLLAISPAYEMATLKKVVGNPAVKIARAMPNTPAMVGSGVAGLCFSEEVTEEERETIRTFFESFGQVIEVREDLMHAVVAVGGSSPAFVYMVIEAMAQGAIQLGIPASDAYTFASAAVEGSAKMVRVTGKHPAVLRDEVCSAGGTTIAGVASLEQSGFKGSLIRAMQETSERFLEMQLEAREGRKLAKRQKRAT
jgi:pyrroline-5-carboxylate reductase